LAANQDIILFLKGLAYYMLYELAIVLENNREISDGK
jgi:hypothetical protein